MLTEVIYGVLILLGSFLGAVGGVLYGVVLANGVMARFHKAQHELKVKQNEQLKKDLDEKQALFQKLMKEEYNKTRGEQ